MERGPFRYSLVQDPLEHVAHLTFHLLWRSSNNFAGNLLILRGRAIAQTLNSLRPRFPVHVVRGLRSSAVHALVETSTLINAIVVINSIVARNHEAKKNVPRFSLTAIPEDIVPQQSVVFERLPWRAVHQT